MSALWSVVLDTAGGPYTYGPFDDEGMAKEFALYLTAEVDPATVAKIRSPVAELLNFWARSRQELEDAAENMAAHQELVGRADRWRRDSTTLNAVGYLLADALTGSRGAESYVGDPVAQAKQVIKQRDMARQLRDALADLLSATTGEAADG